MSHANRPSERRAKRKQRQIWLEAPQPLEERQLLAPVMSIFDRTAAIGTSVTTTVGNITTITGTIVVNTAASANSAAGFTSVAQLTSLNSFGGDMVRIEAGPGGDFGKAVYAISRGAGANANENFRDASLSAPINRPGVIYRVDPVTGKSSVFFDLNTVLNQIDPGAPLGNGSLPGTGLINWYDLAFDPEGIFDGKPSLFVTSLSDTDAAKNAVYRIGPDGSFLGLFIRFGEDPSTSLFPIQPSAILVPPVEQQGFLRGLLVGDASNDGTNGDTVLFFDANKFQPGQDVIGPNPAKGISLTGLTLGPQFGLTAANTIYASPEYSVFTNYGVPPSPISPPQPGLSGVQGLQGELLINDGIGIFFANVIEDAGGDFFYFIEDTTFVSPDTSAAIATPFRQFQDTSFDSYQYFSYGATVTPGTGGARATVAPIPPTYAGSLFVTDMLPGLFLNLTAGDRTVTIPVAGPGSFTITVDTTNTPNQLLDLQYEADNNFGGRVARIGPDGVVTPFAEGFHVFGSQEADSTIQSTLSISFSADGTTLYVADMDGIWQFKTVTSLAGATSGSLIGLNDLRSFGVPYEGQDLAIAVVDTGVDASNPLFRGRVARGKNILTNGRGDDDLTSLPQGHGTEIAGIIAQFVPQSTLVPINVFRPNSGSAAPTPGGTDGQVVWSGLKYLTQNPYTRDPVRPNTLDRIMAANFGFGTTTTFATEGEAYRAHPQLVLSLKGQFQRMRRLGIAPVAATGQFGAVPGTAPSTINGDLNGEAMPAIFNETISVGGVFSFPFATGPDTEPTDPPIGAIPRPLGPILVTDNTGAIIGANLTVLTAGDTVIFSDRLLQASNRGRVTDYVAPALDTPTFVRTSTATTTTVGGTGLMVFQEGGTSISSAIVTGSFAVVASALDYWVTIAQNGGVTADAYVNVPVGTRVLNFGPHEIANLETYLTPDGVNSILQWTAVPARDEPNEGDAVQAQQLFPYAGGPFPQISRIDVGNAVASIEGTIALQYLIRHGTFDVIDSNHNGLVTAQEIQTFVDNANTIGMPEAGALARFLGGTARVTTEGFQPTAAGEEPEQPDVLQRRYNYFDYAADGQLDGVVSLEQWRMLASNLMPAPDGFVVVDRQRSSGNGYLLDPDKERNYVALQYTKPKYAFVPAGIVKRFKNVSPNRFGINRGLLPGTGSPQFTLFEAPRRVNRVAKAKKAKVETPTTTPKTDTTTPATNPGTTDVNTPQKPYSQQALDQFFKTVADSLTKKNG